MNPSARSLQISFSPLNIPMRESFKHASAERKVTESIWTVATRDGSIQGLGEGCPRSYVTDETMDAALTWLEQNRSRIESEIHDLASLKTWVERNDSQIDACPGAWCSVELALLDLFAREKNQTVEALLGLPEPQGPFQYTAVVGDGTQESLVKLVNQYFFFQFTDFKFKISGELETDRAKLKTFRDLTPDEYQGKTRVRLDANNLWTDLDAASAYLSQIDFPLYAVEEPLASRDPESLSQLSARFGLPIILDECLCRPSDVERFASLPGQWIANIRVSKVGGLLRALKIAARAKEMGWPIIVGAQVGETSVLTRAALPVAQSSRPNLVAQEGAFGLLLLNEEKVEPFIMFGAGGAMSFPPEDCETPEVFATGWGLKMV